MTGKYWVLRCKGCGKWGCKETRTELTKSNFKCFFCGKSSTVKKKTQFGLAMSHKGPYETGLQASQVCGALNMQGAEQ